MSRPIFNPEMGTHALYHVPRHTLSDEASEWHDQPCVASANIPRPQPLSDPVMCKRNKASLAVPSLIIRKHSKASSAEPPHINREQNSESSIEPPIIRKHKCFIR